MEKASVNHVRVRVWSGPIVSLNTVLLASPRSHGREPGPVCGLLHKEGLEELPWPSQTSCFTWVSWSPFWIFVVVQLLSRVQLFSIPWTAAHQVYLSFTISWSLLKLVSIESVMPSNHLILHCSLLLLPSILSASRSCKWAFSSHHVVKVLELQLQYQSFSEYSGFISFKIDWFDLLTVQGTLKSLLQCHHSKATIPWLSVFFMVQCSHSYDYWKNHSFDYTVCTC